MFAVSF